MSMRATSPIADMPRQQPSNRWKLHRMAILCCCIGLSILAMSLTGVALYQHYSYTYSHVMALAHDGEGHLQTAKTLLQHLTQGSLDAHSTGQAQQEFAAAFSDFSRIENDLEQVPGIATSIPKGGHLLSTALKLVQLAKEISQAGMVGCDALTIVISRLHEPLDARSQGITMNDLAIIRRNVAEIQGLLDTAANQVNQLQLADLQADSRFGPTVATFRAELPKLQTGLKDAQIVLSVAPALLGIGQPASFLIEQLDSTEVRPGGGFIGSYGIVTFSGGRLAGLQMRDTYLLDVPYAAAGHKIPFPPAYHWFPLASNYSWSLRDSNLDADFPTAARYAEQLYHTEGGTIPLQGVIAVTPWLIENALKITGPIYVSEYQETITAQNLVDRIHFHQLKEEVNGGDVPSPDGHSSLRKRFTEILFEHFFARVRQVWPTEAGQFLSLLRNSLTTKDFQVYFNSNTVEGLLQGYQLTSAIQAPAGDGLLVVDANIGGGKPNNFIRYLLQDRVTIDASGNALHNTTLVYNWPVSANQFQNGFGYQNVYNDYVRVYTPPGGTLLAQKGWIPAGSSEAFGRQVWAGFFLLSYGQRGTISLTWMVHAAAMHNTNGWHYKYLIQRQAGITWHLNLQMTLPVCAHAAHTASQLAFGNERNGTLNQDLSTNLALGVNYNC